jgi:diguanylate cyclase (GGDEF)-like protein/PAS domain S-box-containing protein
VNELPRSDARWLRSVFENSSENVTIVESDGTLRYASPAFGRMLGYDPDEAVGTMNVLDHVHPDDLSLVLEETQKALSAGGVATNKVEYRFRHKEGYWRWVESVGTYLLDDPDVRGVVVQTRDVTERKEAQERLAESEERYRTLVERVPAITYEHVHKPGEFSGTTYVSPQVETILGYTQEEYTAEPEFWKTIVHPGDRERVLAEDERTGSTGEAFNLEYRMISKDGRVVWLRESGTLVRSEGHDRQIWHGVMFDITELKRVEEDLREAEARYRTLVERVPPIIYIQRLREGETAAYDTTYMSPRVEDLLGYPPGRFVADPGFWDSLIYSEDRERVLAEDERTDRTGEPFAMEYRMITKNGRLVWVRDEATLVRDEAGEPLYWLGVQMDITDRKYSEQALRDAEERYRSLVEQIPAVTYIDCADGSEEPLYTSPQIEEMLGYTPEEWLTGKLWPERLHPDDRERVLAADERFESGAAERFSEEYRLIAKDGSVVWVREDAVAVEDEAGEPLYWQGVIFDITERKEAEEALRSSEERLRNLADSAFEGILITDKGEILEANRALTDMLGYELEEMVGRSALEFVVPECRDLVRRKIATGAEEPYEIVGVRKDGSVLDLEVRGRAFTYRGRNVRVTAVRDITERKALEKHLRQQALHDTLTGLPNRKLFVDRLRHALERTRRRSGQKVAVLFLDLDGFKVVNDSLGHEAGDLLLTVVAQRLGRCLRPEDTLARFGGDEFVILVEDVENPGDAVRVARRITEEFQRQFVLEGRSLYTSTSVGIALGDARTKTSEDILRDADTAMYRAKEERADYRLFDPTLYERAVGRLELESDLRRAVEAEEFVLYYQPIVDLGTGEVWGVEALVRWEHPERGLLEPSEFMPVFEESGMIVPMGEMALEEACRQAKVWQDDSRIPPLVVSVNLSARQLRRPDLFRAIENALRKTGLNARCLSLDITETAYIRALEEKIAALDRLKEVGIGISIDDFGVGYSSLSYLKRLPADILKIDLSFVRGVGEDAGDTAIVRMVIDLAHTLGMKVVAEGVEGWAQETLLREMGCDMAQGYYFAGPLSPEELSKFLAR